MLLYAQLFGCVTRTIAIDIHAESNINELQQRILQLVDGIVIKRFIFAGRQLDDRTKTIGQTQKEDKSNTTQSFQMQVWLMGLCVMLGMFR